jgi:DNA repair ATPase RecN
MKEVKKLYYHKLMSKSENKIQTTWKIIKKQIAKNQGMDNTPQIQLGNNKINNPNEIVNALNEYFTTIAEKLTTVDSAKNEVIRLLDSFKADNVTEMRLIPTTETEIKYIIKTLKTKNSTGYDGISSRVLKKLYGCGKQTT